MRETKVTLPETSECVRLTLEVVISEVRYGISGKAIVGQGGWRDKFCRGRLDNHADRETGEKQLTLAIR